MSTFGDRVKLARQAVKMSQQTLARQAGVSQSLIAGIERGAYSESKSLMRLASALDVSPAWLATGKHAPGSETDGDASIYENRQLRMQYLVHQHPGGAEEIAEILRISPETVQNYVGSEAIRNQAARQIEKDLGLPDGWLDRPGPVEDAPNVALPKHVRSKSQIVVWETPEDLPPDEGRVWIDRYDYHCSAGSGLVQWEMREKQALPFTMDFFRAIGASPQHSRLMTVRGNSMEPLLFDRDMMMVDTSKTTVRDGKIYAVCLDDEPLVKQVFRQPGGGLTLHSFNPQYPDRTLSLDDLQYVQIIGELIYRSGAGFN